MTHKTDISLAIIASLFCTPDAYAMHQISLPSTSASTQALSPYEELEQLTSQEATAKKNLEQKKIEFDNSRCLCCLTHKTAAYCADVAGLIGGPSFLSYGHCPDMMPECESACGLPQRSALIGSTFIGALWITCTMFLIGTHKAAVEAEELELLEICSKKDQVESEIRDLEKLTTRLAILKNLNRKDTNR